MLAPLIHCHLPQKPLPLSLADRVQALDLEPTYHRRLGRPHHVCGGRIGDDIAYR